MADPKFKRGCKPTPKNLLRALPHLKAGGHGEEVAYVPPKLGMWGNDKDGDCVSAEEAFNIACLTPSVLLADNVVVAWARRHGFLNGADLLSVVQTMQQTGMAVGKQEYRDGGPMTVDYTDEAALQTAVAMGRVKVAIDADALPDGAGNEQGWYALDGGSFTNTDHCVSVCGMGTAGFLYDALKVARPSEIGADTPGYLVFTWATIGFVSFDWLQGTVTEALLRRPNTVGVPPLPEPAPPTPTPTPAPTPTPTPAPTPAPTPGPQQVELSGRLQVDLTGLPGGGMPAGLPPLPVEELLKLLLAWLLQWNAARQSTRRTEGDGDAPRPTPKA